MRPLCALLVSLGCAGRSDAELTAEARSAAREGAPERAMSVCESTRDPESCISGVLHALPNRASLQCGLFAGDLADECEFLKAEALVELGSDAEAVAACGQAGRFQSDCAEHIWKYVDRHRADDADALLAALVAALPEHAHTLAPDSRAIARKRLRVALNDVVAISPTTCPQPTDPLCDEVLASMLRRRWISASRRSASARSALCAEGFPDLARVAPGWEGLAWDRSPSLDAAFLSAREAACTGKGDDRSAKGFGVQHATPP